MGEAGEGATFYNDLHRSLNRQCTIAAMVGYEVDLFQSDEGVSVSCPQLPGCWSQGATEAEALANIQVAIQEYVDAMDELAH